MLPKEINGEERVTKRHCSIGTASAVVGWSVDSHLPACLVGMYPSFSRAQLIHELDVETECEEMNNIIECANFAAVVTHFSKST